MIKKDSTFLEDLKEDFETEFKRGLGEDGQGKVPKDFWKSFSGMANTLGGKIILGVTEKKGVFTIVGIPNIEKVKDELWSNLNNKSKVSTNPLNESDVETVDCGGKSILVVNIKRVSRDIRPVFIGGNPFIGTYLRNNTGDFLLTEDKVKKLIGEQDSRSTYDKLDIEESDWERDLDKESIEAYKNIFRNKKPDHIFLTYDDTKFLQAIGAVCHTDNQKVTVAGLLCLGTYSALSHFFSHFTLDYREVGADKNLSRWTDRVFSDGNWSGNIFDFYRRTLPKLEAGLKIPYAVDADSIREDRSPVFVAVKEALINSLIHADYQDTVGVRIFKNSSSFIFKNPGIFICPLEEALMGGRSEARNPIIQQILQLIGIGERAGSGLVSIQDAWKLNNWKQPRIEENFKLNEIEIVLDMVSLYPAESAEKLDRHFGTDWKSLDSDAQNILMIIGSEQKSSNTRIQLLTGIHRGDLTTKLAGLVDSGFLIPDGNTRGRTYTLSTEYSVTVITPAINKTTPQATPQATPQGKTEKLLAAITGEMSSGEILLKLGLKDRKYFSKAYLRPAIKEGLVEEKLKDKSSSPNQKYFLTEKGKKLRESDK